VRSILPFEQHFCVFLPIISRKEIKIWTVAILSAFNCCMSVDGITGASPNFKLVVNVRIIVFSHQKYVQNSYV